MNQREAKQRQKVIGLTLAGLQEMLVNNTSLLQELDPNQEKWFKDLIGLAIHKGYAEL